MIDFLSNAACNVHIFSVVLQPVVERVDGLCVHDMLREFIPYVEHSLAKEVFPGACSTAQQSNRPDHWDGLTLNRSAVG